MPKIMKRGAFDLIWVIIEELCHLLLTEENPKA